MVYLLTYGVNTKYFFTFINPAVGRGSALKN